MFPEHRRLPKGSVNELKGILQHFVIGWFFTYEPSLNYPKYSFGQIRRLQTPQLLHLTRRDSKNI